MTFREYQELSRKTSIYPNIGNNWVYPALGLAGETGEIMEKLKKVMRDKGGVINEKERGLIGKELGDLLWYTAQLCSELKLSFDDIAKENIDKLLSRKKRGKLKGSGDDR